MTGFYRVLDDGHGTIVLTTRFPDISDKAASYLVVGGMTNPSRAELVARLLNEHEGRAQPETRSPLANSGTEPMQSEEPDD